MLKICLGEATEDDDSSLRDIIETKTEGLPAPASKASVVTVTCVMDRSAEPLDDILIASGSV